MELACGESPAKTVDAPNGVDSRQLDAASQRDAMLDAAPVNQLSFTVDGQNFTYTTQAFFIQDSGRFRFGVLDRDGSGELHIMLPLNTANGASNLTNCFSVTPPQVRLDRFSGPIETLMADGAAGTNCRITLSAVGAVGTVVSGTFSAVVRKDQGSPTHMISNGTFSITRTQ